MRLDESEARRRFSTARVARLATADEAGRPHVVPVTFAVAGALVVTAVDDKPKDSRDLKRLRNIAANPRVCLLVDHYDEDWSRLWWVRADGQARILSDAAAMAQPLTWLAAKYLPYARRRPAGPVIEVRVERWAGWAAHDPST